MTTNKSIVSPSCVFATPEELAAEHLKDFMNNDVKRRKSILQMEYEAKLRRYAERLKQTEQRVVDLANRRQVEKLEKIARNRKRYEKVENKINAININLILRKIDRNTAWKNRDQKKMNQIVKTREIKVAEKQEKLLQRYMTLVEKQNQKLKKNAALIDRCIVNPHLYSKDKPVENTEEIDEIETESQEESSEQCSLYFQTAMMKPGVDRISNYENRVKIMERIENLKVKFNACDKGLMFWEKTAPLWNRMTQCLNAALTKARDESSDKSSPPSDHGKVPVHNSPMPSLMQQVMMDDVDYNLTDKEMIEMLTKSRKLAGPNATAVEIVNLAKRLVEHKAEVKACAAYMVHCLAERSVFEFVKREVSKVIFADMRWTVDRLQHVNDAGVIPNEPINKKDAAGVTRLVCDLISDDAPHRFDQPLDDERAYVQITSHSAARKIRECLLSDNEPQPESETAEDLFPMPCRDELPEIVNKTVSRFLDQAHYNTAQLLSVYRSKISETEVIWSGWGEITMWNVYRISRKLTKYAFDMFISDKVKESDLLEAVDAYQTMVVRRTPRVEYNRRVRPPPPEKLNSKFFMKRLEILDHEWMKSKAF